MTNETKHIDIATFKAKCSSCTNIFEYPMLSDFSYGEFVFCSENGKIFAYCNIKTPVCKLLQVILPENVGATIFQTALAELADSQLGQKFKLGLRCPNCLSDNIRYPYSDKVGYMQVNYVSYQNLLSLKRNDLINKVLAFSET